MGLNNSGGGAPAAHAASHEDGGGDEVDATGLTGVGGGGGVEPLLATSVSRSSSNQSIPNNVATAISFQTEVRDDESQWAISPNPTRVVAAVTGTYDLFARASWQSEVGGFLRNLGLYKNGVLIREVSTSPQAFLAQSIYEPGVALAAGDFIELKVKHDNGSSVSIQAGSQTTYLVVMRGSDPEAFFLDVAVSSLVFRPSFRTIGQTPQEDGTDASVTLNFGSIDLFAKDDNASTTAEVYVSGTSPEVDISAGASAVTVTEADVEIDSGGPIFLVGGAHPGDLHYLQDTDGVQFPQASGEPAAPVENQTYYDTTTHKLRTFDGTSWHDLW